MGLRIHCKREWKVDNSFLVEIGVRPGSRFVEIDLREFFVHLARRCLVVRANESLAIFFLIAFDLSRGPLFVLLVFSPHLRQAYNLYLALLA